ncbi:OadG family transporter subunit [Tannerella sp.]|uniref:OadG family transporter subunit n=1 Tax=Tannerella sp. TaxID=2382127 RepID=UPI0026DCC789|nr:OadG family transporter subunit [Tannerella sp.]MDO4702899.1 OadG family transporter subunit [Tannerella sp.]
MKKTGIMLAILMLIGSFYANGQSTSSIRLNEVLVINVDNFVDAYGSRNGWIELYNNSPGTVDIRGCYITNDKNNPKKYMIPKGDVKTKVPPRQHVLFWADNNPSHGTFHLNFKLDPNKENELFFYDSDGRTLIDHVIVPAGQQPDVSYGLSLDGIGTWGILSRVTPDTNNKTLDSNEKIENFKQNDSWGVGMTLTAMTVVFLGLLILFLVFKQVGKSAIKMSRKRAEKAAGGRSGSAGINESGEVFAAIATALYEVTEDTHDLENRVLTIHKVTRNYSPWSSKIYGLRSIPSKR